MDMIDMKGIHSPKEEVKQKIVDWIIKNHEHHEGSDRAEMTLSDGKIVTHKNEYLCTDGNYPYVNSLELVKFIEQL
jgi:major membrane immunogen (membrane-anchored lipoprotein)